MSVDHPLASVPDSAPASARARARSIRIALIEDSPEYALLVRHLLQEELGASVVIDHRGSIAEAKTALVDEDLGCVELELARQATHDALTGLPNRTLFLDRLRLTLARIERREKACAVLASTSTASRRSMTAWATMSATGYWCRRPTGCGRSCVRATPSLASAATSSWSCATT